MSENNQAKFLKNYQAPEFLIPTTDLVFNLDDNQTLVQSKLHVTRQGEHLFPLVLDSQVNQVLELRIDGQKFSDWQESEDKLVINTTANDFLLEIDCVVDPANNTQLEGLYKSSGVYCTQCEAEGFRRITPFLDRPDVLSTFTVTIFADKANFPYLLSNGNPIEQGDSAEDNSHWVKWHDPFPKPSYLFALVAGDFDCLTDEFVTRTGRKVSLELFVDKGNLHLSQHAMTSLIKSMAWDEEKYGLEYDLDKYMIVAVDFFNMGAMENKGLNVFNSKYVLADENTATDQDYHGVESVIAHEYFHNWTGNRVTCRDWFQLSLKEGLTVFRDQQFSADMGSEVIERISHANVMRTMQFAEDAGPMSHPIRPEKVIEMNNFYTVTVYDKGAEVIRMMHSLLGEQGFRAGMDLYFERHDGQAVTCDDFVSAMADANNSDLTQFRNWYSQAGTPVVTVTESAVGNVKALTLSQSIPDRNETAKTLVIPVKYEVLSQTTGQSLERGTFILDAEEKSLEINATEAVEVVLFENFSAPVKVQRELSMQQRIHIVKYATDPFARWDQMQAIWYQVCLSDGQLADTLSTVFNFVLADEQISDAVKAELLAIPSFNALAEFYPEVDVEQILASKDAAIQVVLRGNKTLIEQRLSGLMQIDNGYQQALVAQRRLKQVLMGYLAHSDSVNIQGLENADYITTVFDSSQNMTERMIALESARIHSKGVFEHITEQMLSKFEDNVLVFDKLCSAVARLESDNVYDAMQMWSEKAQFNRKNPNRIRSLYGAFIMGNPKQFHHESGRGYQFLTELLIEIDAYNPQLASRMIVPLLSFKQFDQNRRDKMLACLTKLNQQKLSKDLFEKVTSALA